MLLPAGLGCCFSAVHRVPCCLLPIPARAAGPLSAEARSGWAGFSHGEHVHGGMLCPGRTAGEAGCPSNDGSVHSTDVCLLASGYWIQRPGPHWTPGDTTSPPSWGCLLSKGWLWGLLDTLHGPRHIHSVSLGRLAPSWGPGWPWTAPGVRYSPGGELVLAGQGRCQPLGNAPRTQGRRS